jgi:glyoxylase-like metal-dependent hydrolase (beta-lactamase superfamily II)
MRVHVLTINCHVGDRVEVLNPVMLVDENQMVLVDCGYPGSLPLLQEAAKKQHLLFEKITALVITHHDIDHMGAAFELVHAYPHIKVYASAAEAPYINGKKKSLRLQQAEELYPLLPDAYKPAALAFQNALMAMKPVRVDLMLDEKDQPFGNDLQVVFTPGHTPGHISLYLQNEKLLIASDALVVENNEFEIANPQFTLDLTGAIASVKKLSALSIHGMVCYHGGEMNTGIEKKFQQLIEKYA